MVITLKKFAIMTLIVVSIMAVGCSKNPASDNNGDGDGNGTGNGGGNGGGIGAAAEYFPIAVGYSWTYDTTLLSQGNSIPLSRTITISGTQTTGNATYYILHDGYTNINTNYRISNNVVRSTNFMGILLKPASSDQTIFDWPILDFNKSAGQNWTIYSISQGDVTQNIFGSRLLPENITTPAGTFANAVRFSTELNSSTSIDGEISSYVDRRYYWLARNVGLVKIVNESYIRGELIATVTNVLREYSFEN